VAKGVVYLLETIEVDEKNTGVHAGALLGEVLKLQSLKKVSPVGKAC